MTTGEAALLVLVGAVVSGINAVAGGGSLISFPMLRFGIGLDSLVANATNSVSLWPGSLSGAFGFSNVLERTRKHLRTLLPPTVLGAVAGGLLLAYTDPHIFDRIVPWLILFAAALLMLQPRVKKLFEKRERTPHPYSAIVAQFFVSLYGGYFGAGMGIMMLAAFAFYIEGNVHELNAVKNWLGLVINFACSIVFAIDGLIDYRVALWLALGSVVGGFVAARLSQRVDPNRLRTVIAVYGVAMAAYYMAKSWGFIQL